MKLRVPMFLALLIGCISPLTANNTEKYLQMVEREFDEADSRTAKFKVVSQPVNKQALTLPCEDFEKNHKEALSRKVGPHPFTFETEKDGRKEQHINFNKTNPLMLAISLGDIGRVSKFLTVVDNVNDDLFTAWGYRQPYYVSHMALDPHYPSEEKVSLSTRLAIITLLGEKGADFNKLPGFFRTGIYDNPPLIVPGLDGSHTNDETDKLMARALLFGADPLVQGSSSSLVCINPTPDRPIGTFGGQANRLCEIAFDDYFVLDRQGVRMRLAPSIKAKFESIKKERLKMLMEASF